MKKKILILAANPVDTMQLRLAEEAREIKNGLKQSEYRDNFELDQQWAVRTKEVRRAMLEFKPNIVHFCGHGAGESGIILEDDAGASHFVTDEALANFFSLFADHVECVVLNACYSEVQARAIARHIPYVVGMNKMIEDRLAISFATAFYDALGAGKPTEFAYRLGCNAIQMAESRKELMPVLVTQKDVTMRSYDIVISCHPKDRSWVEQNLYQPLLKCKRMDGQRPNIYYQLSQTDSGVMLSPTDALEQVWEALQSSQHIIPVYSPAYFDDKHTSWVLKKIVELSVFDEHKKIHPVIAEPHTQVPPFYKGSFGYLETTKSDWIADLLKSLGLVYQAEERQLHIVFTRQPAEITLQQVMPEVEVEIRNEQGPMDLPEQVTISAEGGELLGERTLSLKDGRALFGGLSMLNAAASVRLVAQIQGLPIGYSQPFPTHAPASLPSQQLFDGSQSILLPRQGRFFFFSSQAACAILKAGVLQVYDSSGKPIGSEISIPGRIRLVHQNGDHAVIVNWEGEVTIVYENGQHHKYSFAKLQGGFSITGAVVSQSGDFYIGFWNGEIYRISPPANPVLIAQHEAGVGALELVAGKLFICDLEGRLTALEEGRPSWSRSVEPSIHLLKAYPHCLVVVGERKLYHLDLGAMILSEEPHTTKIVSAMAGLNQLVITDIQGRGWRYDPELIIRSRFQAQPGSKLYEISQDASNCVLSNPDDGWSLVVGEQTGYRLNDPISISPRGDLVAIGVDQKTNLMKTSDLLALLGEGRNE